VIGLNKRGQVTLFIIIGIVMLMSIALFLYFKGIIAVGEEPEAISPELMPIKNYIDMCLEDVSRDGITAIGLNGGYIKFPPEIENNPASYLSILPINALKLPYWWYDGISSIPREDFIISQIREHVKDGVKDCVDFSVFKDFDIEEKNELEVDVEFARNGVIVRADYPLLIRNKLNNTQSELSEFSATVPVRLKQVYDLAREIMEKENAENFLEEKTIDLITLDREIPTTDLEATCEKREWRLPQIRTKLQKLLRVNLPYIKIEGTAYDEDAYVPNPFGDSTFNDSYYGYHYVWHVTDLLYPDTHVSFSYDDKWPLVLNARPSNNGILKSNMQRGGDYLSFFCLQLWHFTYDAVYPVKVTIVDDKTKEHDSYVFNYAFKVSVDHNQPFRENFATRVLEGTDRPTSEEFCDGYGKNILIYTDDNTTAEPITDVNITFSCGRYVCDMGQSYWMGLGAAAGIEKKFPYCVNGVLRGKREGYEDAQMFIASNKDGKIYTIYMNPIKEISSYTVVKHPSSNPNIEERLAPDEMATIIISNGTFETYGSYPGEGFPIKLKAKDDYTYYTTIYLVNGENLIGGYSGSWDVSWDELRTARTIKFHTIVQDPPGSNEAERYAFMAGLAAESGKVAEPELR